MAYTTFGVNDDNAVRKWSAELAIAERDSLDIAPLMGEDDDAIIHVKKELENGSGSEVTFSLRARPKGDGFTEGETAEGNAESLSFFSDKLMINDLGMVVGASSKHTVDQQRILFDLRDECKKSLAEWWADVKSKSFLNQVCGYTPETIIKKTGMNAVTAPAAKAGFTRQLWAGAATNDQSLSNSDTFTVGLIDRAVEAARTGSPSVRQVMVGGNMKYVAYLHEGQITQMKTSVAEGEWKNINSFAYSGVNVKENPIYNGSLGEYAGVILRRSQDVTHGVNSSTGASVTTARRAVLLGAQAAAMAFGMKTYGGDRKYRWSEMLKDHDRKLEVGSWSIFGLKKVVYDSTDYGTVVISTYSST